MSQHVDFLKSIPRSKDPLSGNVIFLCAGIAMILLLIGSLVLGANQYSKNKQLKLAQIAHQEAGNAFKKIAEAYPLFASDTPLVTKVAEFEKILRDKEAHFAELTHTTSRIPFSKYMQTLSLTTPEGLWLTSFSISEDSGNISLAGFATDPVAITVFLNNLQKSPPFNGETFDLFTVNKIEKSGLHQFEVANNQLLNKDNAHDKK